MTDKAASAADTGSPPTWAWPEFAAVPAGAGAPSINTTPAHSFGSAYRGTEEVRTLLEKGRRDYFAFPGSLIGLHANVRVSGDTAVTVPGEDFLKFHFKLSGNNTIRFAGGGEVNLRGGCMAVAIHPRGLNKVDAHGHDATEHSITFACRPPLLTETLRLDPDVLPEPLRAFARGQDPSLYLRVMPLTARVTKTIEEMLACPYSGRFSHVHAEARALDLICMVLDVLVNDEAGSDVRLTPRDVGAIEAVRDLLNHRFMDPPTIAEIARQASMNRTKLTQGFRYLFNETILDYCQRLRMQRARELLLNGLPVGTVAIEVGYEHHSSFAHAFRSYFGYAPVELRRSRPAR